MTAAQSEAASLRHADGILDAPSTSAMVWIAEGARPGPWPWLQPGEPR